MIFRPFRSEDKAAVIDLLVASYGGWHGDQNDAFWKWKFERNPHGNARIHVADDEGRIAGCYILNPVRVQVGDESLLGAQSVDAAVSTDYRGRGVFTDLAQTALKDAAEEGIGIVYAFPTQGAFGGQVRVGFKPQLVVPKAYRPLVGPTMRRRSTGFMLDEVSDFDDRFDVFSRRGRDRELSVQRDPAYLQWRYFEHPTQKYEAISAQRDGETCGYCVLTIDATRTPVSPGYIVDLQVLPESGSAAAFLADHAVRRLRAQHARVGVTWERPSGPEQDALRSLGFSSLYVTLRRLLTRRSYVDQLIVFEPEDDHRAAGQSPRWSLVPGDADYI
jgi:ribosomal protein S18 acetylase RimI-like enzyme